MRNGVENLPGCIQALLDQRRDPLAEPAVQAWLLEHPDQLEPFARFCAALASTAAAPAPATRSLRRLLPVAACVLAAAIAFRPRAAAMPATLPRPEFAGAGRVVSFSTCTAVAGSGDEAPGPASSWSATVQAGTAAVHRTASFAWRAAPLPSVPLCVLTIRAEENEPSCPRP